MAVLGNSPFTFLTEERTDADSPLDEILVQDIAINTHFLKVNVDTLNTNVQTLQAEVNTLQFQQSLLADVLVVAYAGL